MSRPLATACFAAAALLGACSTEVVSPLDFHISAVVTAQPGPDSISCQVSWKSQVNDPTRIYLFEVGISGDTGIAPDTGFAFLSDSAFANGSASVAATFRTRNLLVGWLFSWDTLSTLDSAVIKGCVVQ